MRVPFKGGGFGAGLSVTTVAKDSTSGRSTRHVRREKACRSAPSLAPRIAQDRSRHRSGAWHLVGGAYNRGSNSRRQYRRSVSPDRRSNGCVDQTRAGQSVSRRVSGKERVMIEFAQFKVLTFDCYGTLIDWDSAIATLVQPWLAEL